MSIYKSMISICLMFSTVSASSSPHQQALPSECLAQSRYVAVETDGLVSEIDVLDESRLSIKFSGWWHGDSITFGFYSRIDDSSVRVWLSPVGVAEREALYFVMQSMAVDISDSAIEILCLSNSPYLRLGRLLYKSV